MEKVSRWNRKAFDELNECNNRNNQYLCEEFRAKFDAIEDIFNKEHILFGLYQYFHFDIPLDKKEPSTKNILGFLYTTIRKNFFTVFSIIEMTKQGMYGPARIMIRYVFESLIVAKYVSITRDLEVIEKFDRGEDISLRRHIGSKLVNITADCKLLWAWNIFCKQAHYTVYSNQVLINMDTEMINQVYANIIFLYVIFDMQEHLITRHFYDSSTQYYLKTYHASEKNSILKKEIKHIIKQGMHEEEDWKLVCKEYRAKWKLKDGSNL